MVVTDSALIEMRCKKCNLKFFDYVIHDSGDACVLDGVCIRCARCKRSFVLSEYTEAMIRSDIVFRNDRYVKSV